jgi:Putative adhesin
MSFSRVSGALTVAALAVAVASTPALQAQARDTSVRVTGSAVVDVTVRTGKLVVRGVDGSTGSVRGGSGNYELRSTGVSLTLVSRDDARGGRDARADRDESTIELDIPRGVRLVVSTLSADVEVREISGSVEVRSTSGDVQLSDIPGRAIVESISGDVRSTGSGTLLRATTVSGDLRVREARGELDLHTTSGDVSVSGERIARFAAESMSGDIQFDGLLTSDARVQISTHSGDVTLRVPDGARGELSLSTFNGELIAGGPLTMLPGDVASTRRGRNARRYVFGTGQAPGLLLDITTFTGDVRLVRGVRP